MKLFTFLESKKRRFFICGLRPVYEIQRNGYCNYYSFQWDTGEFKEDMSYSLKISEDSDEDIEEVNKEEFDAYVLSLKSSKGFPK